MSFREIFSMAYNVIRHFPGLPPLFPGSAVSAWPLGQVRILQSSYDDGQVDNKTKGGLGTGGGPELVLFCSIFFYLCIWLHWVTVRWIVIVLSKTENPVWGYSGSRLGSGETQALSSYHNLGALRPRVTSLSLFNQWSPEADEEDSCEGHVNNYL